MTDLWNTLRLPLILLILAMSVLQKRAVLMVNKGGACLLTPGCPLKVRMGQMIHKRVLHAGPLEQ